MREVVFHKHSIEYNYCVLTLGNTMIYNGKKYYISAQGYWTRDERVNGNRKALLLHRVIWEDNFGPISGNGHIHHIDGNKLNNNLDNLEYHSIASHISIHRKNEYKCGKLSYLRNAKINSLKTHEGKKRHSDGCVKGWENRKYITKRCKRCNTSFKTQSPQRKWCSSSCKYKNWWHKDK